MADTGAAFPLVSEVCHADYSRLLWRSRYPQEGSRSLEDATIKLAAVASEATDVSARAMLTDLLEGQTNPHLLADLAQGICAANASNWSRY